LYLRGPLLKGGKGERRGGRGDKKEEGRGREVRELVHCPRKKKRKKSAPMV